MSRCRYGPQQLVVRYSPPAAVVQHAGGCGSGGQCGAAATWRSGFGRQADGRRQCSSGTVVGSSGTVACSTSAGLPPVGCARLLGVLLTCDCEAVVRQLTQQHGMGTGWHGMGLSGPCFAAKVLGRTYMYTMPRYLTSHCFCFWL
jgi:hypothetical protein